MGAWFIYLNVHSLSHSLRWGAVLYDEAGAFRRHFITFSACTSSLLHLLVGVCRSLAAAPSLPALLQAPLKVPRKVVRALDAASFALC